MMPRFFFTVLGTLLYMTVSGQTFIGEPGVYVLGRLNVPMATAEYTKSFVAGAAVRTKWDSLETSPGVFNWSFLDSEIANANAFGKKISILVVGYAGWLSSVGVPMYDYIDNNPISATYLDTLQAPITWSATYVNRLSMLIQQLGIKYSNDTTVTYINCGAGNMNNNLPNHVASGVDFWTATGYHRDTLVAKMEQVLDVYMTAFPNTATWNSLENIWFEPQASGNPFNYVITQFANYGEATYPDRFGAWREDLTGCQNTTSTNSQWFTVASHPCRTGGQMTYNVQDGPSRMNQCGLVPNTKDFVLQSAFNKGFSMNMRYFEVYKEDIDDTTLTATIQFASDSTQQVYLFCNPTLGAHMESNETIYIYPNPTTNMLNISVPRDEEYQIKITNSMGEEVFNQKSSRVAEKAIDLSQFHTGIYFLSVITGQGKLLSRKIILQ